MSCTIRKATPRDLPRIREIYEVARQFMRKNGNHSQWGKGDEPEALIEEDICQGNLYVLDMYLSPLSVNYNSYCPLRSQQFIILPVSCCYDHISAAAWIILLQFKHIFFTCVCDDQIFQ